MFEPWRSIPWVLVFWNVECLAKDSEKTYMSGNPKRWFLGGILLVEPPVVLPNILKHVYFWGSETLTVLSVLFHFPFQKQPRDWTEQMNIFRHGAFLPRCMFRAEKCFGRLRQPKATFDKLPEVRSRNHGMRPAAQDISSTWLTHMVLIQPPWFFVP